MKAAKSSKDAQSFIEQLHQILKLQSSATGRYAGKGQDKRRGQKRKGKGAEPEGAQGPKDGRVVTENDESVADYLTLDIVQDMAFECSIDQKCSRFIQDRLKLSIDIKEEERFYDKLLKDPSIDFSRLMTDQNGNYILQLILQNTQKQENGSIYQKFLFDQIMENLYEFAVHKHACRVIQTCFDVFSIKQQEMMISMLMKEKRIKDCSFDFNGNHVV